MDRWNFNELYSTEDEFNKDVEFVKNNLNKLLKYQNKLSDFKVLKEFLLFDTKVGNILSKLSFYTTMLLEQDQRKQEYIIKEKLISNLGTDYATNTSWVDNEIAGLSKEIVNQVKNDSDTKTYLFSIKEIIRTKKHNLTPAEEKLLSVFAPSETAVKLHSTLAVADRKYHQIDGVEITEANWTNLISKERDPKKRYEIFKAIYSHYEENKYSYYEIYHDIVANNIKNAKLRKYNHFLDMFLEGDNISKSVFLNLLEFTNKNTSEVKRFLKIKKDYLGLTSLRSFDQYINMIENNTKYSYQEAKDLFLASLSNLYPSDYIAKAKSVISDGYVDVYPRDGKASGAFSYACELSKPYILINYDSSLEDIFTLAHEAGHSVHYIYAKEHQDSVNEGYPIFIAEIASTINEHNLYDYLLSKDNTSLDERIYLVENAIKNIISTFYGQVLLAEFEYKVHLAESKDELLTYEDYNNIIKELFKNYYDIDITPEVYKGFLWAYVPHIFESPFYVYKYATSIAGSLAIYEQIKESKDFTKFIKMLSLGGSKPTLEIAKAGGLDYSNQALYSGITKRLNELNNILEQLIYEKNTTK